MSVLEETKAKMKMAIDHFQQELKGLRTNRASPAMLDNVVVEAYGSQMRIRDLASVTVPEARQLLITPYDAQMTIPIAKAIEKANLNLQPKPEKNLIRISIPPMDEATRKKIVEQGKKKAEEAKVVVREVRRQQNDAVRSQKSSGSITEDDLRVAEKKIQELTDQNCKLIDELFVAREKEIMTI